MTKTDNVHRSLDRMTHVFGKGVNDVNACMNEGQCMKVRVRMSSESATLLPLQ